MALARPITALVCGLGILSASADLRSEPTPCAVGPLAQMAAAGASTRTPRTVGALTVASLNLAGRAELAQVLAGWANRRGADILLLQEAGGAARDGVEFVADAAKRLGFASAYTPARAFEEGGTQGLAIVSRYPLTDVHVRPLEYHRLRFRSRCRFAMSATVLAPEGPVRVVNVHLDTRINQAQRLAQVETAIAASTGEWGSRVIGGDLNTANVRWLRSMWPIPFGQRQAEAVLKRMTEAGFHTPFVDTPPTFSALGWGQKLDWVYLSRDLETQDVGVDDLPFTDHRGVWTRVARRAVSSPGSGPRAARR